MELVYEKLDIIWLYSILFHINYNIMKCWIYLIIYCKFLDFGVFNIVSFKQTMWNVNKFESIIIFWKCDFKNQILKDCIVMNFVQWCWRGGIVNWYCVLVLCQNIYYPTKKSIEFFFDNGESKCKCFVENIWENVVSFKPYLVAPTWSNLLKH